jgi:dienelactone hydrolase
MEKVKRSLKKVWLVLVAVVGLILAALFGLNGPTVNPPTPATAGLNSFQVVLQGIASYNTTFFYLTEAGRYPLCVFIPGNPTYKTDYYNFTGELAERGYIVAIPELHDYNGNVTIEADAVSTIINYALSDTFPLKNSLRARKIAVMGHSHAGDGIVRAARNDGRILTVVSYAPVSSGTSDTAQMWQTFLVMVGQNDTVCPPSNGLAHYNAATREKEYINIKGATHELGMWKPGGGAPNATIQAVVLRYTTAWLKWFFYGDPEGPLEFFNNQNDGDNIGNDPLVYQWQSSYMLISNYELGTPNSGTMGPGWNNPYHGKPGYPNSRAEITTGKPYVFNGQKAANVTFEWDWAGASYSGWPNPATVYIGTMFKFAWLPGDYVGSMLYTGTGSFTITNHGNWWGIGGAGISEVNLTALGLEPHAGEWIPIEVCWINEIDKVQLWWKNVKVGEATWTGSSVSTFYMGYSHYTEQHQYWYSEYWDRTVVATTFINYSYAEYYDQLSVGWNTIAPMDVDVGHTLSQVAASLDYDIVSWTTVVLQFPNGTRYPYIKTYTVHANVTVTSTGCTFYIYVTAPGKWTHYYP